MTIKNEIYNILSDYDLNFDLYDRGVKDAIIDYLENYAKIDYKMYSEYPFEDNIGVCGISFIEQGIPQLVMFTYSNI